MVGFDVVPLHLAFRATGEAFPMLVRDEENAGW